MSCRSQVNIRWFNKGSGKDYGEIQCAMCVGMGVVMWDSPLYAVNMFYYHWLIKKLIVPVKGQNIARLESRRERGRERVNFRNLRCKS